jgi:hypothetical protein
MNGLIGGLHGYEIRAVYFKLIRFDKAEVCATADDKLKINARRGRRPGDRYPFL